MKQLFLKPAEDPPIKVEPKVPAVSSTSKTVSLSFKPAAPAHKGGPAWPYPGIHPPPWWHDVTDINKLSPYARKSIAIRAKFAAKRNKALAEAEAPKEPPFNPADLLDNTVVEGKTISEWVKLDQESETKAKATSNGKGFFVYESPLSGWVAWAVSKWKDHGAPTRFDAIKIQYEALIDKARDQEKFAAMDEKEAAELLEAVKPSKKSKYKANDDLVQKDRNRAEKKAEAARKKMARAEELRAEAEALIENYKKGATP